MKLPGEVRPLEGECRLRRTQQVVCFRQAGPLVLSYPINAKSADSSFPSCELECY